ncbi:hypothetical protein [Catenulispora rubra]|uniref:hypothetical protein n=1 Tax=Catenulispora rubra TaxID=280293 RepID=UPI0018925729|nr:hypothetical protein [Catenulispora rubra]
MGTRIAFTNANALIERCDVADVILAAGRNSIEDGAVLPADNWRPLNATEAEELRANANDAPASMIELVRVLADSSVPAPGRPLIEHVNAFNPFASHHDADFLAAGDEQPGQTTTTIDTTVGLHLGIHLDNHDKLNLAERTASRRRVGLNLGPGVRHLLVGTLDIFDIFDICAAIDAVPRHYPHTNDIRRHVAAGRQLRVLRIRLNPGDAYIAPTELVPHDGSTLTAAAPSRIAFWLGHWPVGTLRSLV